MTDDIGSVRAKLIEILREAPGGLQGAKLAERLRASLPGFLPANHGARNIKEFIELNVPELSVFGKAGSDVVYVLKPTRATLDATSASRATCAAMSTTMEAPSNLPLWSIWATPTTSLVIDIASDGSCAVVSASGAMHRRLNPLSAERHREIARSFLSRHESKIAQEQIGQLRAAVDLPINSWWAAWLRALKTDASTNAIWLPFRSELLQKLLEDDVRSLGLTPEAAAKAARSIAASRRPHQPSNVSVTSDSNAVNPSQRLRQIVLEAISALDDSSLREIKLPVGLVFDIITNGIK